MSLPVENAPETLRREIRRWRLIAGALLLVILGLGGFGAYLLRSLDADYSDLLDDSLPVLNELRVLGNDALSAQRALLNGLLAENDGARGEAIVRARRSLEAGRDLRGSLGRRALFADQAAAHGLLERTGEIYSQAVGDALLQLKAGRIGEADAQRRNNARPALDRYLEQIDISARYVESHSQAVNDHYSDSVRSRSTIMVAVASLPLVAGVLVLLLVIVLVVVMVLMFRRLGPDEAT